VCVAPNTQWNTQIVSDNVGNCIVVWQDRRSGSNDNIYAQKINSNGDPVWQNDGIAVARTLGQQFYPQVVADNVGGAVIVWEDNRTGLGYDIYAQRVNANGILAWSPNGLPVCTSTGYQYTPQIINQDNFFIVAWEDKRGNDFDIYAQRLSLNGTTMWDPNGTPVATLPGDQFSAQLISDGLYGAILAWSDFHLGGSTTDIFSHRFGANGKPAGGCYRTFGQEELGLKAVKIKRPSGEIINKPNQGNIRDSVFGRGLYPQGVALGVERLDSNKIYGWEYYTKPLYMRRAFPQNGWPRPFDRIGDRVFKGVLRNRSVNLYDNALAGELLALKLNIAASDAGLTAPRLGELVFVDSSAEAAPLNMKSLRTLGGTVDSFMTYYKVLPANYDSLNAILHRINTSFTGPWDTVSSSPLKATTTHELFALPYLIPGSDVPPALPAFVPRNINEDLPGQFTLLQNYPNPFNPYTTIEFAIPEASVVTLKVYNIVGQVVATLIDHAAMGDGHQILDFDATTLASGVYFYQLIADPVSSRGKLVTRVNKMLLIK
jgi:hypothetical protein